MTLDNNDNHVTALPNKDDTNQFNHVNGRPSKKEQLEIEKILQQYYVNSISAYITSKKTGFNIKTVNKYFNEWYKEGAQLETPNFIQKCKEEKARVLMSLENQICTLDQDKKDIQELIYTSKKTGNLAYLEKFYKIKLKIIENLGKFFAARINLVNAVTADTVFDLEQKEEKNGN